MGWAEFYPMSHLYNYFVFKVSLHVIALDSNFPTHYYFTVSEDREPLFLRKAAHLNNLLEIDSVIIDTDTTAWSVALLLFNMNNLSYALSKKHIIMTADSIPGHLKKLKKKNTTESQVLKHRAKISFFGEDEGDSVCTFPAAYDLVIKMIEVHDKIYVDKILNINDSIHGPAVNHIDNSSMITFFTWELAEGTIKKWRVRMSQDDYISSYSYTTIAIYVGDWSFLGTVRFDYFNYQWDDCKNTVEDE